jgi:hypothetical protein
VTSSPVWEPLDPTVTASSALALDVDVVDAGESTDGAAATADGLLAACVGVGVGGIAVLLDDAVDVDGCRRTGVGRGVAATVAGAVAGGVLAMTVTVPAM